MGELLAWATPKGMGINGGSALELEASGVEMGDPLIMDLPHMGGGGPGEVPGEWHLVCRSGNGT